MRRIKPGRWQLLLLGLFSAGALLAAGCDNNGGGASEGSTRPPAVPNDARPVATAEFGGGASGQPDGNAVLVTMSCADGLLVIATESEEVQAELPCDRMPSEEIIQAYLGQAARITLVPSDQAGGCASGEACGKLFVRAEGAGSLEFTVGRAWFVDRE